RPVASRRPDDSRLGVRGGRSRLPPNDGCPTTANHGSFAREVRSSLMSPHHALHDPIFLAYLRVIFVSLFVGGIVLGILHWGFRKDLGSIWSTYRSWLVLAPVGMAAIFAGRVPTIIGVTLLAIFGF